MKKKTIGVAFLVLFALVMAVPVLAADFRVSDKGQAVNISTGEEIRNLYTAGNVISVNGKIIKDFIGAGNTITITNDIGDDLWAVGGTLLVRGNIGGSVRVAGGNIVIEGEVKEDILMVGGNIVLSENASVLGDVLIAGGVVEISGPVAGNVKIGGGQVYINSKISGNVNIKVDESLQLGDRAEIGGNLVYSALKEAEISEQAVVSGEIEFNKIDFKRKGVFKGAATLFGILTLAFLIRLLIGIATGLVLVYVFKVLSRETVKGALANFWSSLGIGFSMMILVPVACVILLITVLGSWLAGLSFVAYILLFLISLAFASLTFGSWLVKKVRKTKEYELNWKTVVWGVVVLNLVMIIPLVGWLVGLVFMLVSLGAVYRLVYQKLIKGKV